MILQGAHRRCSLWLMVFAVQENDAFFNMWIFGMRWISLPWRRGLPQSCALDSN